MYRKGGIHPSPAPRTAAHTPGGYGIRPYSRGVRPRRPGDVHRTANVRGTHICVPYNRRGGIHAAREPSAAANVKSPPHVGAGRLTAHNERRQPAKLARSCGCLPRGGKHCSLPSFAALNCGPVLATPQRPASTGAEPDALRTNKNPPRIRCTGDWKNSIACLHGYSATAAFRASTRSVLSHFTPRSSRPMWP